VTEQPDYTPGLQALFVRQSRVSPSLRPKVTLHRQLACIIIFLMMRISAVLLTLVALAALAVAQRDSAPATPDYSGMYTFLADGEFVQLSVEQSGKVSGYVSRYGSLDSDRGAFLDQYFKSAALDGNRLTWVTEPVHGVWFEFKGTVGRGNGKTPNDEGYYTMRGTLTEYSADAAKKNSARSREVTLKSFPQDVSLDSKNQD
jgi:hypothetical protein